MKILVTGGAGFIGSHIVEYLVQRGDDVTILDNLNTGKVENLSKVKNDINFVNGDIREYKLLEGLVSDSDGVFHEAALASVQQSFKMQDEYFDVNVSGTENILKLAKEYGFKVVYASSSSVYGNPKQIPIRESDSRSPINPYAQTKLEAELLAEKYSEMGVKVIGLRYFNVFGSRQDPVSEYAAVIPRFITALMRGEPPTIHGDGEQTRDFTFVGNIVRANLHALEHPNAPGQIFNIAMGAVNSLNQIAKTLQELTGVDAVPQYTEPRPGDIRHSLADVSKAAELLQFEPQISVVEGLNVTIDWYRAQSSATGTK